MVLAASTAAGSIDNGVGRRVTIDSDGGRRWRWLGRGGGWVEGGWCGWCCFFGARVLTYLELYC